MTLKNKVYNMRKVMLMVWTGGIPERTMTSSTLVIYIF